MEIVIHRVNNVKTLNKIQPKYGIEIDIRSHNSNLILSHDPYKKGESLDSFLNEYKHGTLVLNIKEAGIEDDVINSVKNSNVKNFFLLDVEFPYIFGKMNSKNNKVAIRYSHYESINTLKNFIGKFNWVWIDTIKTFPLDLESIKVLNLFKSCFVCPERWGRPNEIHAYKKYFKKLNYFPNCIMTNIEYAKIWNS